MTDSEKKHEEVDREEEDDSVSPEMEQRRPTDKSNMGMDDDDGALEGMPDQDG